MFLWARKTVRYKYADFGSSWPLISRHSERGNLIAKEGGFGVDAALLLKEHSFLDGNDTFIQRQSLIND